MAPPRYPIQRAALVGALLFAVTPVHVESVAFVSGRTDLLAAVFILLASCLWVRERLGNGARPWPGRTIGLAAFLMAVLSKEVALMLPAVLLSWDLLLAGKSERGVLRGWWQRNGFWASGCVAVIAVAAYLRWGAAGLPFWPPAEAGAQQNLPWLTTTPAMIPLVAATYFKLLVLPWPLSSFYTSFDLRWSIVTVTGALVFLGLCLFLSGERHGRRGLLALTWTVGFLLPVLRFFPVKAAVVAERFLYLPSVGFCLAVGVAAAWPAEGRARQVLWVCLPGALLLMAGGTLIRQEAWKSNLAIYEDMARTSPFHPEGHNSLGAMLAEEGRYEEAVEAHGRALRLWPNYAEAHYNLGNAYRALRRYREAEESYRAALRHKPEYVQAMINLGLVHHDQGLFPAAVETFAGGIRLSGDNSRLHNNLGNTYLAMDLHERAVESYRQALLIDPEFGDAYFNLGNALMSLGRFQEAKGSYQKALGRMPEDPGTLNNLAIACQSLGDYQEAIAVYRRAIRSDPTFPRTYANLGGAYLTLNRYREAAASFRELIGRQPENALARYGLGLALAGSGEIEGALREARLLKGLDPELSEKLRVKIGGGDP